MSSDVIIPYSLLAAVLVVAAVSDLRAQKIPNLLTYPALAAALIFHTGLRGWEGLWFSLAGAAVGLGIFIIPYLLGGMGAGDAKLMGAVGGFLGPHGVFLAAICTALAGGVYAVGLLALRGHIGDTARRYWAMLRTYLGTRNFIYLPPAGNEKKPRLFYGLAIAMGTLVAVSIGDTLW